MMAEAFQLVNVAISPCGSTAILYVFSLEYAYLSAYTDMDRYIYTHKYYLGVSLKIQLKCMPEPAEKSHSYQKDVEI